MADDPYDSDIRPAASAATGQLRFFQISTAVLALLLLAGVAFYEYRQHVLEPVTILVNGAPVATVESITAASSVVRAVHVRQVGEEFMAEDDPHFAEDVVFRRTNGDAAIDSTDGATTKLAAATHTLVQGDVIIVDGKWIVALPNAADAQTAVDDLRNHYASLPPIDPLAEKPSFVQNVTIERHTISSALAAPTPDAAAAILWTPPQAKTYIVQPRQTGWLIAKKFKLSFANFLKANSNIDVNHISPGDVVTVSNTSPPVDVVVKKLEQKDETFGGTGIRQVTVESTYIDGQLVGVPIATNMITVQRATPRRSLD